MSNSSQTGFTSISAKFDTTGIENPFYESSSKGDSLIEQMKNNILLVNEVEINVRETKKQKQKILCPTLSVNGRFNAVLASV